ncbi:MAG: hypothetical protein BroJett021_05660 [Chloroflexota bacterium]|nr:MAG: hypothetical protein BroJett021_05660 [Chloroflexota bacterium]
MARKPRSAAQSNADLSLTEFTRTFFTTLGATVRQDSSQVQHALDVELTEPLRQHFGRERLRLIFHTGEAEPDAELVAHGSRIFDQMMALLDQKGAFAVLRAPVKHQGGELLLSAIRLTNASVSRLRLQERARMLFVFTWRITYRADDKQQEIFTVWLDDDGRLIHQPDAISDDAAPGSDYARLLQEAEPAAVERNDAGETLPPRLPALTQLTRLAERARSYAIYHADVRCVTHEAEILPRLYKTLNRLITYYEQQIGEVQAARDPEGERRRALEADLRRKVGEEIENHRLRVEVELIGYVAVEVPIAVAEMTLTTGRHEVAVRVEQDRYSGALRRPTCHACGDETATATIDRNGHLMCERCTHLCAGCNDLLCTLCGVAPCPVCSAENCDQCGQMCWACGERACTVHISVCPTCGDSVCHACQAECAACGVRQCKSHLRSDCVAEARSVQELICPRCAVRCPGCQQFSAHTGVCDASGQRFCQNCLIVCAGCGRTVGPGYYQHSAADQQLYCRECLHECMFCQALTHETKSCAVCERSGCPTCVGRCVVCGRELCTAHSLRMSGCGHVVCNLDLQECGVCHELVCPRCAAVCPVCDNFHCEAHAMRCTQCGQEYCTACVSRVGLCATCTVISIGGIPVDRLALAWEDDPAAQALIPHYRWVVGSNRRYDIYVGEGAMMSAAIVVIDRNANTRRVVWMRRLSALDRLRSRLGI